METEKLAPGVPLENNSPININNAALSSNDQTCLSSAYSFAKKTGILSIIVTILCVILIILTIVLVPIIINDTQNNNSFPTGTFSITISLYVVAIVASVIKLVQLGFGIAAGVKLFGINNHEVEQRYTTLAILMIVFTIIISIGAIVVSFMITKKIRSDYPNLIE